MAVSAARTCFGAAAAGAAWVELRCAALGSAAEAAGETGPAAGCATAEGLEVEALLSGEFEAEGILDADGSFAVEAPGFATAAAGLGLEALGWSGLAVEAGNTVAGEGLGMEALACIGLGAVAGAEIGLSVGDPGSDGEADSVTAGSSESGAGADGGAAKTVDWSALVG